MREVPTSVMALSIIGLLLGLISLVGGCGNIGLFVIDPAPLLKALPQMAIYITDPATRAFTLVQGIINVPLNGVLIAACIAGFSLRRWARSTMIGIAWIKIAMALIAQVFQFFYVAPKMIALYPAGSAERAGAEFRRFLGPVFLLLILAYPVCVIYFYRRQRVIDAFFGLMARPGYFPVGPAADAPPAANLPASNPVDEQFP